MMAGSLTAPPRAGRRGCRNAVTPMQERHRRQSRRGTATLPSGREAQVVEQVAVGGDELRHRVELRRARTSAGWSSSASSTTDDRVDDRRGVEPDLQPDADQVLAGRGSRRSAPTATSASPSTNTVCTSAMTSDRDRARAGPCCRRRAAGRASTPSSMRNDTPHAPTVAPTSSSRGNHTFFTRLALPSRASMPEVSPLARKVHGSSPHSRKKAKMCSPLGSPTGGSTLRKNPNTSE